MKSIKEKQFIFLSIVILSLIVILLGDRFTRRGFTKKVNPYEGTPTYQIPEEYQNYPKYESEKLGILGITFIGIGFIGYCVLFGTVSWEVVKNIKKKKERVNKKKCIYLGFLILIFLDFIHSIITNSKYFYYNTDQQQKLIDLVLGINSFLLHTALLIGFLFAYIKLAMLDEKKRISLKKFFICYFILDLLSGILLYFCGYLPIVFIFFYSSSWVYNVKNFFPLTYWSIGFIIQLIYWVIYIFAFILTEKVSDESNRKIKVPRNRTGDLLMNNSRKWKIVGIICLIIAVVFMIFGFDKLLNTEDYRNTYVNGDAYNFIVNASRATAFFVLSCFFGICSVGSGIFYYLGKRE